MKFSLHSTTWCSKCTKVFSLLSLTPPTIHHLAQSHCIAAQIRAEIRTKQFLEPIWLCPWQYSRNLKKGKRQPLVPTFLLCSAVSSQVFSWDCKSYSWPQGHWGHHWHHTGIYTTHWILIQTSQPQAGLQMLLPWRLPPVEDSSLTLVNLTSTFCKPWTYINN